MSDCRHGIPIGERHCEACLDERLDREWNQIRRDEVYDAAMALFEHEQGYKPQDDDLANGWTAYRAGRARLMLDLTDACRRAKGETE